MLGLKVIERKRGYFVDVCWCAEVVTKDCSAGDEDVFAVTIFSYVIQCHLVKRFGDLKDLFAQLDDFLRTASAYKIDDGIYVTGMFEFCITLRGKVAQVVFHHPCSHITDAAGVKF